MFSLSRMRKLFLVMKVQNYFGAFWSEKGQERAVCSKIESAADVENKSPALKIVKKMINEKCM